MRARIIPLLLFGSGFCALIYQTTWLREFRLVFGASTAASAAVLGVFMAGIGFGGIFLGRRSETKAKPLAFYARLELLIAISAALTPLLIWGARYFYILLGGTHAMGMGLGTIARLILAALIMGTPTFLMGGTLPAAARAAVRPDDISRRAIGVLYGTNTLGAVTGALVGTFYCFEHFGNRLTLWLAAVLNIGIALIALRVSRAMPDFAGQSKAAKESSAASPMRETSPFFVFIGAGLVGFAFFLMELVWYRMLGPLLGGSTFSFGLILSAALLGIGMGGIAYAVLDLKRSATLGFFAITCAAEAFFVALPYALGDRIAMATMLMRPLGSLGFYGHVSAWSIISLIVIFPAAFVSGIQFPLLIALLGRARKNVGSQTGAAYAWNTMGALLGSLAGGFGFIPIFSAPGVWRIVVVILAALAFVAALLALRPPRQWISAIISVAFGIVALVFLTATGPTAFWRHSQIGVGRVNQFQGSPNQMRNLMHTMRRKIMWEKDGRESSVALSNSESLAFIVNGRIDGNSKLDAGTQIMSGLIGAVLHPAPANALVIGLGTGSTAGWLAAVPSIQRVDAFELEPAILKVAEACAPVNHAALANPKLHVSIGDARELLLTAREKYDIIVSEPSSPYRAGVAGLFTREYYQSVDRCLRPGGMFCQWVQAYDIDGRTMQTFYRTLKSVFANVESWQTEPGDLLLLASREPIHYNVDALRHRIAEQPFKDALLVTWQADNLESFLAHYVGNNTVAETLANLAPLPLNTDDRTVIEFGFARSVSAPSGFELTGLRASAHNAAVDKPESIEGEVDWSLVEEARLSTYAAMERPEVVFSGLTTEQRDRASALFHYLKGDFNTAVHFWRTQSQEPRTLPEMTMLAESLAVQGDNAALSYIDKVAVLSPLDAAAIRAQVLFAARKGPEAAQDFADFFEALRANPWSSKDLIKRSISRARIVANADQSRSASRFLYESLNAPFSVFNSETDRQAALLAIALYIDGDHAGYYTHQAMEVYEPNPVWDREFLETRLACYKSENDLRADQAKRDLDEFLRYELSTDDVDTLTKALETRSKRKH